MVKKIALGVVGVVGALIVIGVVLSLVLPSHRGEVIFTSSPLSASDNCKVSDQVTEIKAGQPVYLMIFWSHTMSSDETVMEEDFKDGVSLGTYPLSKSNYAGYDCTTSTQNVTDLFSEPGTYELKFTVNGEVVADGKLTVTP